MDLLVKAILMNAASAMAAGVISNLPDTLKLDVDVKDSETQAENLMAFRVCHVFYDGLIRALDVKAGWATPQVDTGATTVEAGPGLLSMAANLGLPDVLKQLIKAIPIPQLAPVGPVPKPSEAVNG